MFHKILQEFKILFLLFIILFLSSCTFKEDKKQNQKDQTTQKKEILSKKLFYMSLSSPPSTLHPIRSSDAVAFRVQSFVIETLLGRDVNSYQLEPRLAVKWKISPDQLVYTLNLRENVFWHDGKPFTSQDVKFSFEAFTNVKYGGVSHLPYFENIERAETVDDHTIRFYAKRKYFGSFEKLTTLLRIVPKHIYEGKFKKLNQILIGTGPYIFKHYDRNKKIILTQNQQWWGRSVFSDQHQFKSIVFRIIHSTHDELIRMAQGQLDYLSLSSESYFKKTNNPPWGKTIFKKKVQNFSPKGYSFIAWNFKNKWFQSKKVRKALNYLMNRTLMNNKFNNNSNYLATGPTYPGSDYADSKIKPLLFSPKKAIQLLKEEGWADLDKNGILEKEIENQKVEFRFTLIFPSKELEKYLTIYQEDLKKNGIIMSLKFMDWVSFVKVLDEKSFDAITLAWVGGEVDWFPKQIWHSESSKNQGSNFISYNHPEVDRLIDLSNTEIDRNKRIKILRNVYRLIAEDYPYIFMFTPRYIFYSHSKNVKMKKSTYNYSVGTKFWWFE